MPLFGKQTSSNVRKATTSTPINSTVTDVASDIATIPANQEGMNVSIWNDGPSPVRVAFDTAATATTGIEIKAEEGYADADLAIATRISAVSTVAGQQALLRGVVWSG